MMFSLMLIRALEFTIICLFMGVKYNKMRQEVIGSAYFFNERLKFAFFFCFEGLLLMGKFLKYRGFLPNASFGSGKNSHQPKFALAKFGKNSQKITLMK